MTGFLLDTNIPIYLEQPSSPFHEAVKKRFLMMTDEDRIYVSILTLYELSYSQALRREVEPHQAEKVQQLIDQIETGFPIIPLRKESAPLFGEIKTAYKRSFPASKHEQQNIKKHDIDFMLASHAILDDLTLVSNDTVFVRIRSLFPKLILDNWAQ